MRYSAITRVCLTLVCLAFLDAGQASAEQDFFGIQMQDDRWAQHLVLGMATSPEFLPSGSVPVLAQSVRAEAAIKDIDESRISLQITVFNDSKNPINASYELRDFFIYTNGGRRFALIDKAPERDLEMIEPQGKAAFRPSVGNLEISNKDVQMISCSFDLGKTRVFLFPWSKKDLITKLQSPAAPVAAAAPAEEKRRGRKHEGRQEDLDKESSKQKKSGPKFSFWNPKKDSQPKPKAEEAVVAPLLLKPEAQPETPKQKEPSLENAIKQFVYVPASGVEAAGGAISALAGGPSSASHQAPAGGPYAASDAAGKRLLVNPATQQAFDWPQERGGSATVRSALNEAPAASSPASAASSASAPPVKKKSFLADSTQSPSAELPARSSAQVIGFNKEFQFITLNMGSADGIRAGAALGVSRGGKIIAKAKVKQIRPKVCAATILPGTQREDIFTGDEIVLL